MKWIKHLSAAHNDQAMARILEDHGAVGYGIYWLILEEISGLMEAGKMEPAAIHAFWKWAEICNVTPRVFRKVLRSLMESGLIQAFECEPSEQLLRNECKPSSQRVQIVVANLLKYNDEYSKKSGHTPEPRARGIRIEGEEKRSYIERDPAATASALRTGAAETEAAAAGPPPKNHDENHGAEPTGAALAIGDDKEAHREIAVRCMEFGMPAPDAAFALKLRHRWPTLSAADAARKYPQWPGQTSAGFWASKSNEDCELETARQKYSEENPYLVRKPPTKESQQMDRLMAYAREKDRRKAAGGQ